MWLSTPGEPAGTGMYQTIKSLYNEKGKKRKLYLAGHSLGGALATNAAARLAYLDDLDIAGIYTIGSPRWACSLTVCLFGAVVVVMSREAAVRRCPKVALLAEPNRPNLKLCRTPPSALFPHNACIGSPEHP